MEGVKQEPGLGELLRYVGELIESGAEEAYTEAGFTYRARYTPVLRALASGAETITDITARSRLTQGAISQTVGLMVADELIERRAVADGRKSGLLLTPLGQKLIERLRPQWDITFLAIATLEREVGHPLMHILEETALALERSGFASRLKSAACAPRKENVMKTDAAPLNWFERGGQAYARFRPEYPQELVSRLAEFAPSRALAVDVGCGTGQLTVQLASAFHAVIGLDPSADQIANAQAAGRVRYDCSPAENLPVADNSASLVTAAQAAHWFGIDAFYAEVRRVLVADGVLALITYGVIEADHEVGRALLHFYHDVIGPFWPPERRHVETGYRSLPFPFVELAPPKLAMRANWSFPELLGYIGTWSAVRNAEATLGQAPLNHFEQQVSRAWGDPAGRREIRWPLSIRIGRR